MLHHEKTLHDDANGVVIPGFWQCVREDPINPVSLQFIMVSAGSACEPFQLLEIRTRVPVLGTHVARELQEDRCGNIVM